MKKTLLFLIVLAMSTIVIGQKMQTSPVVMPADHPAYEAFVPDGLGVATIPETDAISLWVLNHNSFYSTGSSAPGNTFNYQRGKYLIKQSEIALTNFPYPAEVNSIGWNVYLPTGLPTPTTQTGQLKIWLMNTADETNLQGTTWSTTGFTMVHDNPSWAVPVTAGAYSISFINGSTFTYTGGGVYVAWEFVNTGTAGANEIGHLVNTTLVGGGCYERSTTGFTGTLTPADGRPATNFGNTAYNDIVNVNQIRTLEKCPTPYGTPTDISVRLSNVFTSPATFDVTVTVKDSATATTRFTSTQTGITLTAGASVVLTFTGWSPTIEEKVTITAATTPIIGDWGGNNTMTVKGIVNNNTFGYIYNTSTLSSNYGYGTGSGLFLAKYTMSGAGSVPGTNLVIGNHSANTGKTIYAVLMNNAGVIVAQSPNYVIQATDLGKLKSFTFTTPYTFVNEFFYVGIAQTAGSPAYYPLGLFAENPVRPGTYYFAGLTGGVPGESTAAYKFGIEAQVVPYAGVLNPVGFNATPASTTQINLGWTQNIYNEAVVVAFNTTNTFGTPVNGTTYAPGAPIPGGGTVLYNGSGTSFNHTGLTHSTVYYYKAWSVNATTNYSTGVTTLAPTYYLPTYLQDFNAGITMPPGWTGNMYVETGHGTSASNGLTFNLYNDPSALSANGISPNIVLPANACKLEFDYRIVNWDGYPATATPLGVNDKVEVQYSTDNGASYTTIYTINQSNHVTSTSFAFKSFNLAPYAGAVKFRFLCTWGVGDYYVDIDNFKVEELPLCPLPTNLAISSVTINSAAVSWSNATNAEIDYGLAGYTAGTGTRISPAINPPVTLSPLVPGTSYDVYVRQDCGGGVFSPWAGPLNFSTLEILSITPNPHNFGNQTTNTQSAPQVFTVKNNGPSPILIDGLWLEGANADQFIKTDATVYPYNLLSGAQYTLSVVFAPTSGGAKAAVLRLSENETDHNVPISGTGVCPDPSDLTVPSVTTTSATLGWTANGGSAWEIELGAFGFTPAGVNTAPGPVTNPYVYPGLTPGTAYSYYVRTVCGNNYSAWIGPYSFVTACVPFDLTYTQNFDALPSPNLPVCWSRYSSAADRPWVTASNVGAYSAPNAAVVYYNSDFAKDEWLVSPAINVTPGLAHEIHFWVKAPGYAGIPERMKLVMSTDPSLPALTTATVLWDNPSMFYSSYAEMVVPFTPASAGPYYFAWHAYSEADVDYIAMDNVSIQMSSVPVNLFVSGTIAPGPSYCYNASNTIMVSNYTVPVGGNATFIAGSMINFQPNTVVAEGGYMLGKISTSYCSPTDAPLAAITGEETTIDRTWFSLFPNPTTGNVTLVQKGSAQYGQVQVEIYSMRGERVLTASMIGAKQEFNTSSLPNGLYFVKLVADGYAETIKLVKTR